MDVAAPTSLGPGRLVVDAAESPTAVLWLGHGAGGGIEARDLAALAAALPGQGITVVRYEQPWRVAGRKVAARPAALDVAWGETTPLVEQIAGGLPVVVGGRSAGARVACRSATSVGAVAVVCLAFPLHPPGHPEKSRLSELLTPEVPVLVLQGERDTFGTAATLAAEVGAAEVSGREGARRSIRVIAVPGADHGMKVLASSPLDAAAVAELLTSSVAAFISEVT
jgi:predicted alpha/beta-hydrolase family hydrolase